MCKNYNFSHSNLSNNVIVIIYRSHKLFASFLCWFFASKQQNTINHMGIRQLVLPNVVLRKAEVAAAGLHMA